MVSFGFAGLFSAFFSRWILSYSTVQFLGSIIIFPTVKHFDALFRARNGGETSIPTSWAQSNMEGVFLIQDIPLGLPIPKAGSIDFQATIVHEVNHVLVYRLTGNEKIPVWLMEGLAETVEAEAAPQRNASNQRALAWAHENSAFVEPALMESVQQFRSLRMEARKAEAAGRRNSILYPQSWQMANFLLNQLQDRSLNEFLVDVRKTKNLSTSMKTFTGRNKEEFYQDYIDWVKAGMPD